MPEPISTEAQRQEQRIAVVERGPDIEVKLTGFSSTEEEIFEGQIVTLHWDVQGGKELNVVQIVPDDEGHVRVPGGYHSGELRAQGVFVVKFNLLGVYMFSSDGFTGKASHLTIRVKERVPYDVQITDSGFTKKVIRIDEGNTIRFLWKDCIIPHSVREIEICDRHAGLLEKHNGRLLALPTGSYTHKFRSPGLYYFLTELKSGGFGLCIVHVSEVSREYRVDVLDRKFEPMILQLEQGDKVWFNWDTNLSKEYHCIYQIEPPALSYPANRKYNQLENGFRWERPSKLGLLAHKFNEPGVFYFSDHNDDSAAEYIGTIIVRPKQKENFIKASPNSFSPAVLEVNANERIWWESAGAEKRQPFLLLQTEHCVNPGNEDGNERKCAGNCNRMTKQHIGAFSKVGLQTTVLRTVGIYHYKIPEPPGPMLAQLPTSSVIVHAGEQNHTIIVDDNGFSPRLLHVTSGSHVWFVWQKAAHPQNIRQVSYLGHHMELGFCSGKIRRAPSAFTHKFEKTGIFYFVSDSAPQQTGTIVVTAQPKIHQIKVARELTPDPLIMMKDDIVYWSFSENRIHDVVKVDKLKQAWLALPGKTVPFRTIMNRAFADDGLYHFTSASLIDRSRHPSRDSIEPEDLRISSVIVDERRESHCIRVDVSGFHPRNITIKQGDSLLWSWTDENDQEHNIIHVNPPNSEAPLSMVEGKASFNSGKPKRGASYMYTFEHAGEFCVASQGAPGYAGSIKVVLDGEKVKTPYIDVGDPKGGSVGRGHMVELKCDDENAEIFYSTDGSLPYPFHKSAMLYDKNKGVILDEPGLMFIRACAVAEGKLDSDVYISNRFSVDEIASDDDRSTVLSSSTEDTDDQEIMAEQYMWRECVREIQAQLLPDSPDEMDITWDALDEDYEHLVQFYRLYINGISYHDAIPPSCSAVSVSGLAGGRYYDIVLECVPTDRNFLPQRSNVISVRTPYRMPSGGPVISLERSSDPDEITIVWVHHRDPENLVEGYYVYLNDVQSGALIKPSETTDRCVARISRAAGTKCKVYVRAVSSRHETRILLSNELEVVLPLDTTQIRLPPPDKRIKEESVYREYIQIWQHTSDQSTGSDSSSGGPTGEGGDTTTEDDQSVEDDTVEEETDEEVNEDERQGLENNDQVGPPSIPVQSKFIEDLRVVEPHGPKSGEIKPPSPKSVQLVHKCATAAEPPLSKKMVIEVQEQYNPPETIKRLNPSVVIAVNESADLEYEPPKVTEIMAAPIQPKVAAFVAPPESYQLPVPVVHISHTDEGELIQWELSDKPDLAYKLTSFAVNVVGEHFAANIKSDYSFECIVNKEGKVVNCVHHVWNVTRDYCCLVSGLANGNTYKIHVAANWTFLAGNHPTETQSRSKQFEYTTIGAPHPPVVYPLRTELLYQVTFAWEKSVSSLVPASGYQILIDGKPSGAPQHADCSQVTLDKLVPGTTIKVQVIAVTDHVVGDSQPSNTLVVTCPRRPDAPLIEQQPSYKRGAVVIAWDAPKPSTDTPGHPANITYYSVYVDGSLHGEVKANQMSDQNGYQYYLLDLKPGVSYDVFVKSICGQKLPDKHQDHIYTLSESNLSNTLPVTCAAPPDSPHIHVEGMSPEGIDITWEMPQQYGEAVLSGYQLLMNDSVYGSTIPPEVTSMRLKGTLGEELRLQIIALTEHPSGGLDHSVEAGARGRYAECKPGPKLIIQYTGLVASISDLWTEKITGHTVMVVWKTKKSAQKAHFLPPDSYQVTWWPGEIPEGNINSCSTSSDHLLLKDMLPNTVYTVIVEARRKQHYLTMDETSPGEEIIRHFIISAKSQKLIIRTGQPPLPASNLGVLASTCHSIQLGWDPPRERGVEVKAVRVDCVPADKQKSQHICHELLPNETTVTLHNMCERTQYDVTVTAITGEYFEQLPAGNEWKALKLIPQSVSRIPDSEWLPKAHLQVATSGTEPPCELTLVKVDEASAVLRWSPAVMHGNNRLLGYVVRWTRLDPSAEKQAEQYMEYMNLHRKETSATIKNLVQGFQYKIIVEAVVSVKTIIEAINGDEEKNRRTTHIPSSPLLVRTRAPVLPPTVLVTGYTVNSIQLFWDKPSLCSVVSKDTDGSPVYIKRYLEGYRLYINGKLYTKLDNGVQNITLTKCKPGKSYEISLVVLTSTEGARREKKRGIRADDDHDESHSLPQTVTLPTIHSGNFDAINAYYLDEPKKLIGSIHVKWVLQSHSSDIKHWNVMWYEENRGNMHKTVLEPHIHNCAIPVMNRRQIYTVSVEPEFYGQELKHQPTQRLQVIIPGPVSAPEIFLRCVTEKDFTIDWGEPRCYGAVRVTGYKLHINEKPIGRILSSSHRKAIIPCKPNRMYQVYMVAIGSDYGSSPPSNTLLVSSPGSRFGPSQLLDSGFIDWQNWESADQTDLQVRSSQVTDTSMKIDWCYHNCPHSVKLFKIIWSCSAQPRDREIVIESAEPEQSMVLQKLFPGITHYVKVLALGEGDLILEKSRQLIVQTNAPPETPVLGIRACNLKYISIHWEKPKVYGTAFITGYRIYVDGICEAVNGPEHLIYNFTTGKFCQEYSFQVQALTDNDLCSKPSDPLLVKWPGLLPPVLRHLPTETNSSLKVGWEAPYCTEGIKIKHFKVVCREADTEKIVQSVSPIHPETEQAEMFNIRKGSYQITLEIYLHGASEIFRSDPLIVEPLIFPDPPNITVTVMNLEERRKLDKITSQLINHRYRLLKVIASGGKNENILTGHRFKKSEIVHAIAKAREYVLHLDDKLEDYFKDLADYTGSLVLHISWTCPQMSPDVLITGYRVLVDGKQFGVTLHSAVNNVRIKLNLETRVHRISMVAVSEKPYGVSAESNLVDVLTDPFRPFTNFCFTNIHQPNERWPSPGCCRFDASVTYEQTHNTIKLCNQGLLVKHMPPPQVSVLDVFDCDFRPLLPENASGRPTILLFWTKWCLASERMMNLMFKFAQFNNHKYDFVSLACGIDMTQYEERQDLIHFISQNGWNDSAAMRHVSNQSRASIPAAQDFIKQNLTGVNHKLLKHQLSEGAELAYGNTSDLLGLAGVPTIVVVHPHNYIAWIGTYCAFDADEFEVFIEHTMGESLKHKCPVNSCQICQANAEMFDLLSAKHTQPLGQWTDSSVQASSSLNATSVKFEPLEPPVRRPSQKSSKSGPKRPASAKPSSARPKVVSLKARPRSALPNKKDQLTVEKRPYQTGAFSSFKEKGTMELSPRIPEPQKLGQEKSIVAD